MERPTAATANQKELQELRVRVAELCGWKHDPMHGPLNAQWLHVESGKRASNETLPDYPSDLNACMTLIDFLADRGWNCTLGNGLDKTWECEFYRPAKLGQAHPDNIGIRDGKTIELIYRPADTQAVAICKAFVATMEARKDVEKRFIKYADSEILVGIASGT